MNGLELKKIRKELNMTQTELSEKVSVTLRTVQNWEKNATEMPESTSLLIRGFFKNSVSTSIDNNKDDIIEFLTKELSLKDEIISLYKVQLDYLKKEILNKIDLIPITEIHEIHELTSRSVLLDFVDKKIKENKV